MCGRFALAPNGADAWASVGDVLGGDAAEALRAVKPRYNIAPSTQIPIVVQNGTTREIQVLAARWGFVPSWWKNPKLPALTNNARIEGIASKPMWGAAWTRARCLIPASVWYEWRAHQQPGSEAGKAAVRAAAGRGRAVHVRRAVLE